MVGSQPLRKLDSTGNEVRTYPIGGKKIIQSNTGYIYIGGGYGQFYLAKVDTAGKIIFQKNFFSNVYGHSLSINNHEEIILGGTVITDTGTTKTNLDALLAKFDYSGNLKRGNVYSLGKTIKGYPTQDGIDNIKITSDGGVIACGTTDYPTGNETYDNILAIKTDSLFNTSPIINVNNVTSILPEDFILYQNYPNPFNPTTKINFDLPKDGKVSLFVYDMAGKEVAKIVNNKYKPAGFYSVEFNAVNLSSGVYIYKLESGNSFQTKKMILIK